MDHSGIFGASVYGVGANVRIGDNQGFENDYRRNNRGVNRMAEKELFGNSEQLNDTISRAAVVDEIEGVDWYHINRNGEMVHGANDAEHQAWYKADDIYAAIERVPPAQPVAKDINVPVKDCISRQAALGALGKRPVVWSDNDDYTLGARNQYDMDRLALETVPSAQRWIPCSECEKRCSKWENSKT